MIVTCPACATRYRVPQSAFAADRGRRVRCRACAFEWQAVPEGAAPAPAPADPGPALTTVEQTMDFGAHLAEAERLERHLKRFGAAGDIESAARTRERRERRSRLRAPIGLAAAVVLMLGAGALFPETAVRLAPGLSRLYGALGVEVNIRGMEFADVAVRRQIEDGTEVLAVSGRIVNLTGRTLNVPAVRFGLRDAAQNVIRSWSAPASGSTVAPGASIPFSTRLAAPPRGASDVVVRFDDGPGRLASRD